MKTTTCDVCGGKLHGAYGHLMGCTLYQPEYKLLSVALAGCSGYPGGNVTSVSIPDRRLTAYYGDVAPGGFVLDKRTVDEGVLINGALNGPMVNVDLNDGAVDRCPDPDPLLVGALVESADLSGNWGMAGPVAKRAADPEWRGLDTVSLPEYLQFWRERGARVGRRVLTQIRWEDGAVDTIRPHQFRWKMADGNLVDE